MYPTSGFNPIPMCMQPSTTVGGCIDVYENAWERCDEIISNLEHACNDPKSGIHWNRATTIGQGILQDRRTNYDLGITYHANLSNNNFLKALHNRFNELIVSAANHYRAKYEIQEDFWQEGYNVLKYESGQEYKSHYDGATAMARHISCILYLNDDYAGGEIEFPNFNVKIKPQAGMLVLFPSNFAYRHIAHPVISGTKYAIVTWLHDRPS